MNLDHLNKEQQKAATHTEGPLLILAGAGSGKTATMTHRIAYLIEQGVSPYSILAVTFTNKAAKEMRDRVETLVGPCPGMWIMTFHAMSLRILREHYNAAGYDKNFVVYDTVDQKSIINDIIKAQNIVDKKSFSQASLLSFISKEKEEDSNPENYFRKNNAVPDAKVKYNVYLEYQRQLKKNNAMDFDDLLLNALHVLRDNPDILAQYQNRFRYIMVDEYQDTNHIQYQIIKMMAMAHQNICVVGDDDQCIYQWRGADIRNILDFEKDFPAAKVIKLEQNYRSCGNILAAAHSVIKNNRGRKSKKLWTEAEDGAPIVYKRYDSDKEEAYYVAQEIDLLSGGRSYDDFAILYRTNAQSRLFEDELKRRHIPYQILSGFSFYERKETKDMICYMRLVTNPVDDLSFKRIINEPKRGIGLATLQKISTLAQKNNKSLFDVLSQEEVIYSLPAKASVSVKEMMDVMKLCQQEKENLRVSDIYDNLLVKTGYMKALEDENTVESEVRIENLLDFKSFIYDFEEEKAEAGEKASLDEFLERVATDSDTDKYDDESGKVTLMTMHSAKGLEFPVVFMPGMEDGLFPGHRAMDSENGIEEERRLCYVGMTRAKERLFLTSAAYRVLYGHGDYTRESTFLRELDKSLLDEAGDTIYEPSRRTNNKLGVGTGSLDGYSENPPFRPYNFDPLKYAKQSVKEAAAGSSENFMQGDQVTHGKFGHGIVVDVDAKTVTVVFEEAGTKKLAKGIAPLKKV